MLRIEAISNGSVSEQIEALQSVLESAVVDGKKAARTVALIADLMETLKSKGEALSTGSATSTPPLSGGRLSHGIAHMAALLASAKNQHRGRIILPKSIAKLAEAYSAAKVFETTGRHETKSGMPLLASTSGTLDEALAVIQELNESIDARFPDEPDEEMEAKIAAAGAFCEEVRELALIELFELQPWTDWDDREGKHERNCVRAAVNLTSRLCGPRFAAGRYGEREAEYDAAALEVLVSPFHCSRYGTDQVVGKDVVSSVDLAAMVARVGWTLAIQTGDTRLAGVLADVAADA